MKGVFGRKRGLKGEGNRLELHGWLEIVKDDGNVKIEGGDTLEGMMGGAGIEELGCCGYIGCGIMLCLVWVTHFQPINMRPKLLHYPQPLPPSPPQTTPPSPQPQVFSPPLHCSSFIFWSPSLLLIFNCLLPGLPASPPLLLFFSPFYFYSSFSYS